VLPPIHFVPVLVYRFSLFSFSWARLSRRPWNPNPRQYWRVRLRNGTAFTVSHKAAHTVIDFRLSGLLYWENCYTDHNTCKSYYSLHSNLPFYQLAAGWLVPIWSLSPGHQTLTETRRDPHPHPNMSSLPALEKRSSWPENHLSVCLS
jgi:hypothetical protein